MKNEPLDQITLKQFTIEVSARTGCGIHVMLPGPGRLIYADAQQRTETTFVVTAVIQSIVDAELQRIAASEPDYSTDVMAHIAVEALSHVQAGQQNGAMFNGARDYCIVRGSLNVDRIPDGELFVVLLL